MIAVLQRVLRAKVTIRDGPDAPRVSGEIGRGLMILLGVGEKDGADDVELLARKVAELRIFEDPEGKMNLSVQEVDGAALVVSQFTLLADARKGRRPSFIAAARPEKAIPLYELFVRSLGGRGVPVATGVFGASMEVDLANDGPVTIILDSNELRGSRRGTGDGE